MVKVSRVDDVTLDLVWGANFHGLCFGGDLAPLGLFGWCERCALCLCVLGRGGCSGCVLVEFSKRSAGASRQKRQKCC